MVEGRPFAEWLDARLMTASADHDLICIPGTSGWISVTAARAYLQARMSTMLELDVMEIKMAALKKQEAVEEKRLAIAAQEEAFAAKARECAERHA